MVALLVLGFDLDFEPAEAGVEGSAVLGDELPDEAVATDAAELVVASDAAELAVAPDSAELAVAPEAAELLAGSDTADAIDVVA